MAGPLWFGDDVLTDFWPDCPSDPGVADTLLIAAQRQCEEYAPALPLDEDGIYINPVPENYQLALVMQARALWQSMVSDTQDGIGEGGFRVTVFPMDWTVKALLRPKRGVPVVG
jgi:hypothetical protein